MKTATANGKGGKSGVPAQLVLNIDPGNGWLKFVTTSGERKCIPSYIRELTPREKGTPDEESALIDLKGDRYAVGRVAGQLGGKQLFELGKPEYGHIAIAAAIALSTAPTDKTLKLRILVPDADKEEWRQFAGQLPDKLASFTAGTEGTIYLPQIQEVELVSEGYPVWKYVRERRLVPDEFAGKMIGVLDAGTGDLTCTLFTESGEIVRDRGASFTTTSMKSLVGELASILEEEVPGYSPDRSVLMELIRQGKFVYEAGGRSFDFQGSYQQLVKRWLRDLMGNLQRDRWSEYWSRLGMVFVVGGASSQLQPLEDATKGRFQILKVDGIDNSQVINAFLLSQL